MADSFARWVADTLLPFAQTAITSWNGDALHIWKGVERPGSPSLPILPTTGYWGVVKGARISQFATPSLAWPPEITPSSHQAMALAALAGPFWEGLDAHIRAFDAPVQHRSVLYVIGVYLHPHPQVFLSARPRGTHTDTYPLPFARRADWAGVRQAILSGPHAS